MTKHNLQQSLAWLLNQTHLADNTIDYTNLPAVSSSTTIDDGPLDSSKEMARLQLAPQNNVRPRLLGQDRPSMGLPTPDTSRSSHERPAPTPATSSRQPPTETPIVPTSHHNPKTPASAYADSVFDDIFDIDDVDQVDLTSGDPASSSFADFGTPEKLWDEAAATRVEPSPEKRGKKRKSDEYREDLRSSPVKPRSNKRKVKAKDLEAHDDEPATHLDDKEEDVSLTQRPGPSGLYGTTTKSTNALSPRPAAGKNLAQSHIWSQEEQNLLPSGSRSMFGDSVPDTDEEDFKSPVKKNERDLSQKTSHLSQRQSATDREASPEAVADVVQPPPKSELSQRELPMPDPAVPTTQTTLFPDSSSTPGMTSKSSKIKITSAERAIIGKFTTSGADGIKNFLQRLQQSKDETNAAIIEYLEDDEAAPPALKEKQKTINARIKAVKQLLDLHVVHSKNIKDKAACKAQVVELMDEH
jgi:hypothetical protein